MKGLIHLKNKQFTPLVMAMILASVTGNLFANKGLEIAILSDKNNDDFIDSSSSIDDYEFNKQTG